MISQLNYRIFISLFDTYNTRVVSQFPYSVAHRTLTLIKTKMDIFHHPRKSKMILNEVYFWTDSVKD